MSPQATYATKSIQSPPPTVPPSERRQKGRLLHESCTPTAPNRALGKKAPAPVMLSFLRLVTPTHPHMIECKHIV